MTRRAPGPRPILFSAPMVRAILDDTKTKTRRVCKKAMSVSVGDRLWVRETFCIPDPSDRCVVYRADMDEAELRDERDARRDMRVETHARWRPSIYMPRWAARILLEVTAVRVERLQAISGDDALAEGIRVPVTAERKPLLRLTGRYLPHEYSHKHPNTWDQHEWYRTHFASLWDTINGKRPGCTWADNPSVAVISFARVTLRGEL